MIEKIAATIALVSSIGTGAYFLDDRHEPRGSSEIVMNYVDKRFEDKRIEDLTRQIDTIYKKEQFGIKVSPPELKHLEWLKYQLQLEISKDAG